DRGEALAGMRRRRAGGDGLAGHRALEHLETRVGGAVAVVETDEAARELAGRVDGRGRRDDESSADDHGAAADLPRPYRAVRHPAVIAALSPLEHRGLAAILELALVRGGLCLRAPHPPPAP